jgi:hypothetical protein
VAVGFGGRSSTLFLTAGSTSGREVEVGGTFGLKGGVEAFVAVGVAVVFGCSTAAFLSSPARANGVREVLEEDIEAEDTRVVAGLIAARKSPLPSKPGSETMPDAEDEVDEDGKTDEKWECTTIAFALALGDITSATALNVALMLEPAADVMTGGRIPLVTVAEAEARPESSNGVGGRSEGASLASVTCPDCRLKPIVEAPNADDSIAAVIPVG